MRGNRAIEGSVQTLQDKSSSTFGRPIGAEGNPPANSRGSQSDMAGTVRALPLLPGLQVKLLLVVNVHWMEGRTI